MKLTEVAVKDIEDRAGFLPYYLDEEGVPIFLFMIPSDPKYGGVLPGVAKGMIDPGEDEITAAIREASEELGMKPSNLKKETIKLVWVGRMHGQYDRYKMTVYAGELKDKNDFNEPHYETGEVRWLTFEEFQRSGRYNQKDVVKAANDLIINQNK